MTIIEQLEDANDQIENLRDALDWERARSDAARDRVRELTAECEALRYQLDVEGPFFFRDLARKLGMGERSELGALLAAVGALMDKINEMTVSKP